MTLVKENGMFYYPPQAEYQAFADEADYSERGRGWGLFGKVPKREFWHKGKTNQQAVTIKGYQQYGHTYVLIIEFKDGSLSSIHPSFLKEMQSSSFGKELIIEEAQDSLEGLGVVDISDDPQAPALPQSSTKKSAPKKQKEPKVYKEKLELPADKVKFTAKVKEFTTKPNPFSDRDDEIMLLEQVIIVREEPLVMGEAWCGYSNTLKSVGLEVGDAFSFEGKVVDKKFNKEILYKVNNPSKLTKLE